jgi:N6-L-threonylcarbamoyladenine synthase
MPEETNLLQPARILGIESSCDETAAAVVENGGRILSNVVASQIDLHAQYGGVFPEVASRQHVKAIYGVVEQALNQAHLSLSDINGIAVTRGPGLPGSLVVGVNMAKGLGLASGLPIMGINHLEGHIYSAWLSPIDSHEEQPEPEFPLLALLVSGGHTELILMHSHLTYERLGKTLDDAAGEAFDKVARLLGLAYPGGPAIQKSAVNGSKDAVHFPRAWLDGSLDFSFSGLKTAVLRLVRKLEQEAKESGAEEGLPVADLAASFQESVVDVLLGKTLAAAKTYQVKQILIAGGVSANQALRQAFYAQTDFPVLVPPLYLCTDNAAMIAAAGYYRFCQGDFVSMDIDILPTWPLV